LLALQGKDPTLSPCHPVTPTPSADWNPAQYERFRDERSAPFYDLLDLVEPRPGMRVVDLGCGTGALTREMHRRLTARETVGIDTSPAMLARSAAIAGEGLRFEQGDIATFAADSAYDLVFSNAAIQWVPDHEPLFARLAAALTPTGQLAVQMPANNDHPSHVTAFAVAGEAPFRDALGGYARQWPVLAPEAYAALLYRLGFTRQHVRLQVYGHELESREAVIEWVRGSLLTDYEKRLPADLWPVFLERYRERLLPQLEDARPFFYPFKRILLWASR
jgi:trans-aconitate 2-methyltransferase